MNLDELTLGQIRELKTMFVEGCSEPKPHPYHIGKNYFIRTVTHHMTGCLVWVGEHELVLEDAAWIADDGRYEHALKTGEFREVEPCPEGEHIVGRGSIIDADVLHHDLPRMVVEA